MLQSLCSDARDSSLRGVVLPESLYLTRASVARDELENVSPAHPSAALAASEGTVPSDALLAVEGFVSLDALQDEVAALGFDEACFLHTSEFGG